MKNMIEKILGPFIPQIVWNRLVRQRNKKRFDDW